MVTGRLYDGPDCTSTAPVQIGSTTQFAGTYSPAVTRLVSSLWTCCGRSTNSTFFFFFSCRECLSNASKCGRSHIMAACVNVASDLAFRNVKVPVTWSRILEQLLPPGRWDLNVFQPAGPIFLFEVTAIQKVYWTEKCGSSGNEGSALFSVGGEHCSIKWLAHKVTSRSAVTSRLFWLLPPLICAHSCP